MEGTSLGNFDEPIYSITQVPALKLDETNRVGYTNPPELTSDFRNHPAYFSDYFAFQHLELWMRGISLKNKKFVPDNSNIPLVFSCRLGANYQKLIGPIKFCFGNIAYHLSDFKTQEEVESNEILINEGLLELFEPGDYINWGCKRNVHLCMGAGNVPQKNFFEMKIQDYKNDLHGSLTFKIKEKYAEIHNSGDKRFPIKEIMTKKWLELESDKSHLAYKDQKIDFSKIQTTCFVDEANGFPCRKNNWDWTIFKNNPEEKNNIWFIMGKKCKRAGYPMNQTEIATLSIDGQIYRLKGNIMFDYDVDNLQNPWIISFYAGKNNCIQGETKNIAPLIERSSINEGIGPIKVKLDLQRIIAETEFEITLNDKKIRTKGISSLESNRGMERGTRYFKD